MTLYDLQQVLSIVFSIGGPVAGAVYTWFATRKAAARNEIVSITERLDAAELQLTAVGTTSATLLNIDRILGDHEKRLLGIESEMKHLPVKEDFHLLQLSMTKMEGTVATLAEKVSGLAHTVNNMDTFMRAEGDKA